jgi:hypothetical protein
MSNTLPDQHVHYMQQTFSLYTKHSRPNFRFSNVFVNIGTANS